MASRDGAASVQGIWLRVTPLLLNGDIDTDLPVLNTKAFLSLSFSPQFADGEEIEEKAADGSVCITYKVDDTFTRAEISLAVCTPDPEQSKIIAGGCLIRDEDDEIVGYGSVNVGEAVGNPVAIEVWSIAVIAGKAASDKPYFHWVFPYAKMRYEGDREFTNGALANEYSGFTVGNEALVISGLNVANASDDFVTYRRILSRPFSYVRTDTVPNTEPLFDGTFPDDVCLVDPYVNPTGVTPGIPGAFTPTGSTAPWDLAHLRSFGALGETTAWTVGQYVDLGNGTTAYWDGDSWEAGEAP